MNLQVYVDETILHLDGVPCLLYGAVVTEDARPAIDELQKIRAKFGVPSHVELKWNMRWGDADQKAEIKEAVVVALQGFTFLVNISLASTKNEAFRSFLGQVRSYCLYAGASTVQICFDRDCFTDYGMMKSELRGWADIPCVLFARGESELCSMLQYADMFAGAFAYMIHKQSAEKVPELVLRERPSGDWVIRLDEYFYLLLRRGLPGVRCAYDPDRGEEDENFWNIDCRGIGVALNGEFSPEQLHLLRDCTTVFKGPLH